MCCYTRVIFGSERALFIQLINDMMTVTPLKIIRNWHKLFYGFQAIIKLSSEELVKVRIKNALNSFDHFMRWRKHLLNIVFTLKRLSQVLKDALISITLNFHIKNMFAQLQSHNKLYIENYNKPSIPFLLEWDLNIHNI